MIDFLTLIGVSFYQTLIIVISLIIALISIIFYWKKHKNFQKITLFSFLFALIIGIIILLLVYLTPESSRMVMDKSGNLISWTWKDETQVLLLMFTNIYLSLIFISIPFLIFVMIVMLVIKKNEISNSKSFFFKTFMSLLIPILIGMFIAIALIPLVNKIELNIINISSKNVFTFITVISETFINTGIMFVEFFPLIVLVPVSIIIGFSIKFYFTKNPSSKDKVIKNFSVTKDVLVNYLEIISFSLPLIIITRISSIFLRPSIFIELLKFIGVFLLGLFFIILVLNIINLIIQKSFKEYFKYYWSYILIAFVKSNSMNYLPDTIRVSEKMGVDKNISEITSIFGLNVGPAICSGYYLMLIGLIGLNTINAITFSNVLIMFLLIMVVNLTTSGLKGGDEMARNIVLSSMTASLGIDSIFYYGSIFAIESILEPIRHIGNSTSYLTSNIINQRWNRKK